MGDSKETDPLNADHKSEKKDCDACTNEDTEELGPPLPIDGGYGWVIMCASFFVNFLVDGVCFSFGIFFIEFLEYYGESKETTSWVGSVLNGAYLSMGPVVGALANKFGCRNVTIVGSIMVTTSLFLSTFSPNVSVLIITYGLLTGVGFGLMYLPAIVMVGYYFEKRRALATGIAVCGSGIGGFVFAPMCEKLLQIYSWKGATWIIAGICLNGMVCGALFRPLEPSRKRKRSKSEGSTDCDKPQEQDKSEQKVLQDKPVAVTRPSAPHSNEPKDLLKGKLKQSLKSTGDKSPPDEHAVDGDLNGKSSTAFSQSMNNLCSAAENTGGPCLSMSCDDIRLRLRNTKKDAAKQEKIAHELQRPMYRKDILYSGSVQSLAEYKKSENMESYVRSITSVPGSEHSTQPEKCSAKNSCSALTNTFKEMMDFTLLANPVFVIYGISCFLCMAGFFVPFIYLPDLGLGVGLDRSQAAFLISLIGIANTVARVLCGWVSDQPWADCLLINNCALMIGGAATMLCPLCKEYWLLAIYSVVFGSCIAAFVSLRSIIMVELMGLEKLTSAFGLVTLCQGLSSFIGAPIAGALFDATGQYNLSFYVAGATLAAAGAICLPLRRIAVWRKKRLAQKAALNSGVAFNPSDMDVIIKDENGHSQTGAVAV